MEIEPGKHGVHNARGTRQDPLPVSGNELINVKKRVKIPDALTNAPKVKFQTQVYVEAGLAETPSLIILPVLGYLGGKNSRWLPIPNWFRRLEQYEGKGFE